MVNGKIDLIGFKKKINRRKLIRLFWLIAIPLGALEAWTGRYSMNPDGISYLDIGDAYFRGDGKMAINAYWSPFYSWLLGLAGYLFKPSPYFESSLVHLVNFLIFLFALVSFHFYLTQLLSFRRSQSDIISKKKAAFLPEEVLLVLNCLLFLWSTLSLTSVESVTPDICVSAFVYLISGLLLKIRLDQRNLLHFATLGILLALGYLSKSPLFILSFIFLAGSVSSLKDPKKAALQSTIALICFFLIAAPFITALTKSKNRLTFGDAGRINYFWFVNNEWITFHSLTGSPLKNPIKVLAEDPLIWEFSLSNKATYPLLFDPTYWHEGVKISFNFKRQLSTVLNNLAKIFTNSENNLILFTLVLFFSISKRKDELLKKFLPYWFLIIPALSALLMYSLIIFDFRHLSPFLVILATSFFSALSQPGKKDTQRWLLPIIFSLVLFISVPLFYHALRQSYSVLKYLVREKTPQSHLQWYLASRMATLGLQKEDKVLYSGDSYGAYWARLAEVQIAAETKESNSFCEANKLIQPEILKLLAKVKIKAVVAQIKSDRCFSPNTWERVGDTDFYLYFLEAD